jgi:sterol desaturase/sphingolipid hydroxylase (fatty acid hydroxylase superfamily)
MESLALLFEKIQSWLFDAFIAPGMFAAGLGGFLEDGYNATGWFLVGVVQLVIMLVLIAPLQRRYPVEPVTDRAAIRVDVIYTLIHRLGLFRVVLFFSLEPLFDDAFGMLRAAGWPTLHLDNLWPGVTDVAWVALLVYLVVFDFVGYWIHRGQHYFGWWWKLHALHHSQRQMTMWTDNRNHLLDDVLVDTIMVVVAQVIGIAPGQFVAVVAFTQLSESFQHANVRMWFGAWGERLWVSPRFHRLHHSVGVGHETINTSTGRAVLGGHNFGVLLPWWDMLFGTANFEHRFDPTGVRDQVEQGVQYGQGFWQQQWLGLKRLLQ